MTVELVLSGQYVDLAESGFDLAVRIGALKDSRLIVQKLGATVLKVVAAPTYIEQFGAPTHPSQLKEHICIRDANNPDPNRWPFLIDGQLVQIPVSGPFIANSPPACVVPTRASKGIFICPDAFLTGDPKTGRLRHLLTDFPSRTISIQTVQLSSAFRRPKVMAFIQALRKEMKA